MMRLMKGPGQEAVIDSRLREYRVAVTKVEFVLIYREQ